MVPMAKVKVRTAVTFSERKSRKAGPSGTGSNVSAGSPVTVSVSS